MNNRKQPATKRDVAKLLKLIKVVDTIFEKKIKNAISENERIKKLDR